MQRLNAIDAIAPAFTRTHQVLFKPFKLGRAWKLAASSYVAFLSTAFVPFPILYFFFPHPSGKTSPIILAILLVFFAIGFGFFYLGVRMSLVNFEMVVTCNQFIAPMWRRYSSRVWPWIALKVAVGTALTLALIPFVRSSGRAVVTMMQNMPQQRPGAPPDPLVMQQIISQILPIYGLFIIIGIVFTLASTLLNDFALPFFVLEDISMPAALKRGLNVMLAEPFQVIAYLLLKFLLAIAGFIAQYIVNLIALIPGGIIFGLMLFVGGLTLRHTGPAGTLVGGVGFVLLYLFFIAYAMFMASGLFGYLMTLLEAYGVYFMGGRYPLLGSMLEPDATQPFTPPPSFPSPEERKDDDGGPPLPMDPALA